MTTKVIKTEEQYFDYLAEVEKLMSNPDSISVEASDRLDVLSVLIEDYESRAYPIELPDPIDAIQFRMEEKGLKQVDLSPYIGSRSRVSEILSRKRPLTVQMIRALNVGLGISAETLIGSISGEKHSETSVDPDWSRFPIKEMITRGWIENIKGAPKRDTEEQVKQFISQFGWGMGNAAFKRTLGGDAYSPTTKYSLYAWVSRVIQNARKKDIDAKQFDPNIFAKGFLTDLVQLSWLDAGPLLAIEYIEKHGIAVVIEPSLGGAKIDGAALKDDNQLPIIAMTMRHDRLDNFWFTLVHELVHLWKHVANEETFLDDLDVSSEDKREAEANRIARDTFIPRSVWKRSNAYLSPTTKSIDQLSRELKIHPSIIAGRVRKETGNYRIFSDLLGQGEVRKHFSSIYQSR